MKSKVVSIFWGVVLILVAGLLFAEKLGYVNFELFSDQGWILVFGIVSAAFFLSYFLAGVKKWGWLFPALIFAAIAVTGWLAINHFEGSYLGMPILLSIAIPFYVGFLANRRNWGLLIPAWILTILSLITLLADWTEGSWIGSLFLFAASLPFLVIYLMNRSHRWALIPAWIMFILALVALLADRVNGNLVGAFFLYSIGLPFLVVYLLNHKHRWALIPAAALAVIGTFPLLDMFVNGDIVGVIVMFLFALPFFFVYFYWKEAWWALIPAGIFGSIGLLVILSLLVPANNEIWESILRGILLLGFSLTFGLLWLRRKTQPTDWAKYPAVGLLAISILTLNLGKNYLDNWAIILLVVGILLVVTGLQPRKTKEPTPPADPS